MRQLATSESLCAGSRTIHPSLGHGAAADECGELLRYNLVLSDHSGRNGPGLVASI